MASAKNAIPEPAQKVAAPNSAPGKTGPTVGGTQKPATPGSRSSAAKEVIPFGWKLIGESDGFALTLFKSIEREDVDAQYERVKRDGHYTNLQILAADDKVKQPSSTKARRARKSAKITKDLERSAKERLAAEAKAKAAKLAPKSTVKSTTKSSGAGRSVKKKAKAVKNAKAKPKVKAKSTAKVKARTKSKAQPKAKAKARAKAKPAKKSATTPKSKAKTKAKKRR